MRNLWVQRGKRREGLHDYEGKRKYMGETAGYGNERRPWGGGGGKACMGSRTIKKKEGCARL